MNLFTVSHRFISNFAPLFFLFFPNFAPIHFQFRTILLLISHCFLLHACWCKITKKILNFSSLLNFALRTSDTLCIALERTWFFNKNHNTILIEIIFGLLLSFTVTLLLFDFYYHGYLFRFYWHCWDRVQDDQRKKCGWE